jgi:hypothetical protein
LTAAEVLLAPPRALLLLPACCCCCWPKVMQPNAAQLAAAVAALINALVASKFSTTGVMGMMNSVSYARWGLEGAQALEWCPLKAPHLVVEQLYSMLAALCSLQWFVVLLCWT